jgi:hypothetical protein
MAASYTTNLGLYRPDRLDEVEVDVSLKTNFDVIDTEVKLINDRVTEATTKVDTLDAKTTELDITVMNTEVGLSDARVRLNDVEYDVEVLKTSGGTGGGSGLGFVDGGSFLDTYTSEGNGLDGGEF